MVAISRGVILFVVFLTLALALLYVRSTQKDSSEPERSDEPRVAQGQVLPGDLLVSQIVTDHPIGYVPIHPLEPRYPSMDREAVQPTWENIHDLKPERLVPTAQAAARFNDEDAVYQIAFHLSHYGGMPASAGDFNADGIEDFINMSHFAYVDGLQYAGEVHVYFGERQTGINSKSSAPNVVFYGEQAMAKLGISIASAGDFNGDGLSDLAISAAFHEN